MELLIFSLTGDEGSFWPPRHFRVLVLKEKNVVGFKGWQLLSLPLLLVQFTTHLTIKLLGVSEGHVVHTAATKPSGSEFFSVSTFFIVTPLKKKQLNSVE